MSEISPPPIFDPLFDISQQPVDGKAKLSWVLFFQQVFAGDTGTSWTPIFTGLTTVGGSPTITAKYYRIGRSMVYFSVRIVPASGGSTTATAGTTQITNFPLRFLADGSCEAVAGGGGGANSGQMIIGTTVIDVPAWTAVTVPLTVCGYGEAS